MAFNKIFFSNRQPWHLKSTAWRYDMDIDWYPPLRWLLTHPPTPYPSTNTTNKCFYFGKTNYFFHSARQYILVSEFSIFMGREEGIGKVWPHPTQTHPNPGEKKNPGPAHVIATRDRSVGIPVDLLTT